MDGKIINDTVHGQITIKPLLMKIIDTSEFQRLRYIKQLAVTNYVYPSANHTRFEHSIGTSYLAGELITHLKNSKMSKEYSIDDRDVLCIEIAGLLHDVGHGPYSHLFEDVVSKALNKKWKHEEMSLKIIDVIYEKLKKDFNSENLYDQEIELIKDMIHFPENIGDRKMQLLHDKWSKKYNSWNKAFLFEIVSNHRNGIDVDKFDYFLRDSLYLGMKVNFDPMRLIKNSCIIKINEVPQICFRETLVGSLYEMFHVRDQLHRYAYQHKVVSAMELMLLEALSLAKNYFKFEERLNDVEKYCKLTDAIFLEILHSDNAELYASRQIIKRIETRKIFKFLTETIVSDKCDSNMIKTIENEILKNMKLESNEILLSRRTFSYGNSDQNPIDNVNFFNKNNFGSSFKITREQVSLMLPEKYQEIILRLYYVKEKNLNNDELMRQLSQTFQNAVKNNSR